MSENSPMFTQKSWRISTKYLVKRKNGFLHLRGTKNANPQARACQSSKLLYYKKNGNVIAFIFFFEKSFLSLILHTLCVAREN